MAALFLITIMTIQGLDYLLPTSLRVYFELQKPKPDGPEVTPEVEKVIRVLPTDLSRQELQNALGLRNGEHFRKTCQRGD
ncbi:hypothetical protein [Paralcaligenes ureilyticus]|uniref:Uncharacterized protein n=1 Tax=Paralcaligenes ureilyticus TaxID=627131 RepID=A0A4R3LXB2_9BURK|nr:hypothetical protein [Paralcaligenes ureilyticus]TCT04846.1 hypothetical protein EDC26_11162 [Paralcaligenes ureilyticus]